ncbi:Beta-catenin-interacting protein ICAT [Popillia japonica]|uniref:Beta-catenin-interacting protein ICAT n=1 Tax=Popillia japonica TaxID=7064 RepID=A0AAW1LZZ0_POPJA
MSSYGKDETDKLRENLQNQLERLVEQLEDLETCRNELDAEEYEETKQDTMEQLKELNNSLNKLISGNITLSSALEAMQLATRAAISQAFKTPEVIKLFGKKEPKQLRERLIDIECAFKLNKLSEDVRDRQKAEILIALRQLGEQLTTSDLQFLEKHNDISNAFKDIEFEAVKDS